MSGQTASFTDFKSNVLVSEPILQGLDSQKFGSLNIIQSVAYSKRCQTSKVKLYAK